MVLRMIKRLNGCFKLELSFTKGKFLRRLEKRRMGGGREQAMEVLGFLVVWRKKNKRGRLRSMVRDLGIRLN